MEQQNILIVEDDADISGFWQRFWKGQDIRSVRLFWNGGAVLYGTKITGLRAVGSDDSGNDRGRGADSDP